jgi:hypothetical protein
VLKGSLMRADWTDCSVYAGLGNQHATKVRFCFRGLRDGFTTFRDSPDQTGRPLGCMVALTVVDGTAQSEKGQPRANRYTPHHSA